MGKRLEKRNEYYAQLTLWGKDQKPTLVCRAGITLASFDKDVDYVLDLMNVCKDDRMKNELQEGLMKITGQEKRRTAKKKPF